MNSLIKKLCDGYVIPAIRTAEDFQFALAHANSPSLILLFGDILSLPGMLKQAQEAKKRVIVHLDLLSGIGKDKAGVKYLAQMGVNAIITTKTHLAKVAHQEGVIVIQRLFLMDSEALRTGVNLLEAFKPDAIEVLPGSVPAVAVDKIIKATGLPVLGGGLISTVEDVNSAINNGICAVSSSERDLWNQCSLKGSARKNG
ncbi:MAG: glycerol-3-phosphate responsive antiterminator, GlpP [Firmicutes bacterium]|nr:glycerol-3-phosphate responsive antiterminator, GlpP [Bacillota bacterium]